MMKVLLAIETSTPEARVGAFDVDTGAPLALAGATSERHSSNLLALCVDVVRRAGVAIRSLGGIACGAGPGSFTGLRVGYAVAKGLAMPHDLPFFAVSSLQALAWDLAPLAGPGDRLLPCLDAGKGQVYVAPFAAGPAAAGDAPGASAAFGRAVERLAEDWVLMPAAVGQTLSTLLGAVGDAQVIVAGTGAVRHRPILEATLGGRARFAPPTGPSAEAIAAHALAQLRRGERADLATAVPAYGRPPDITRPKAGGRRGAPPPA